MMRVRVSLLSDPMIIILLSVIALAITVPVSSGVLDILRILAACAIFVLFLVNGLRIARSEIIRGFANWRFLVPLSVWVFGVMSLAGWGVSLAMIRLDLLPPLLALGFLYLGVLPSTVQSATSYTMLAGGSVGLAVVGAALLNMMGVAISAPLFALLSGGEAAQVGPETLLRIGGLLLLPFCIGLAVQGWFGKSVREHRAATVWVDRFVIGLSVYVSASGAIAGGLSKLVSTGQWAVLIAAVLAMLALIYTLVWALGGWLGYVRADRIAFLFAGAQKSLAVGAPLATLMFPPEQAGMMIAPLLLYHLFQLIAAAPIAAWLARPVADHA